MVIKMMVIKMMVVKREGEEQNNAMAESVEVIRQCVEVIRQWLELRRLLVDDDDGKRQRARERGVSIYTKEERRLRSTTKHLS